ncbi:hypothetical protein INH39_28970 [Massilia violaceinigra]|uniref:Transcription factor zinc-finger domain-containing protein n=1 Tax=Massilia violaceinigra TaxID=2045208 RepID=A0ABY4A9X4_9BURK|nr:hypothetical protein [Massilia violaceinigra]UOD29393.1 hypothetical protein INH39_28970 [Massilia violaceinigra]
MKSSQPVESQAMCSELLDKIVGDASLSEIRDLLLRFKAKGVRAPQIAHFLMAVVRQHQAGPAHLALPDEVEEKLCDVLDVVCGLVADHFAVWASACKWGPARPIAYLESLCPVCAAGILGIRRLDDAGTMVIACHECEAVWTNPGEITTANALHPTEPDFGAAELGAAIFGDQAAWASADDIHRYGWGKYISGEETHVY